MAKQIAERPLLYNDMEAATGLSIAYEPQADGSVLLEARGSGVPTISAKLPRESVDQAHILYMEATELLSSRAKINQAPANIRKTAEQLFAAFRGEKVAIEREMKHVPVQTEFVPNPGKQLEIDLNGVRYMRFPVKTRLITTDDRDLLPIIEEYAKPHLKPGDLLFVSEKALCITQQRVVDMNDMHPGFFARLFARNVGNQYGTKEFHGFGHGTAIAMQALIDEAGYPRALFAAIAAVVTRPFGIRGAFYYLCGKQAKSIDCPMSFLILEYAHAIKLAPKNPNGNARRFKQALGCDVVVLDANYRGAFSLGRSSRSIAESFIQQLFRDNPLGQSDEMTPFCIVRRA